MFACDSVRVQNVISDMKEHRLFENRVLWRIFGPKRDELTGSGEITRSFVTCAPRQT
jgi:hypothetical protein